MIPQNFLPIIEKNLLPIIEEKPPPIIENPLRTNANIIQVVNNSLSLPKKEKKIDKKLGRSFSNNLKIFHSNPLHSKKNSCMMHEDLQSSEKLMESTSFIFEKKNWIHNTHILYQLKQFIHQGQNAKTPRKITKKFISYRLLPLLNISNKINIVAHCFPYLHDLLITKKTKTFCEKIKLLDEKKRQHVIELIGKQIFACLKLSLKKKTRNAWEIEAKNIFEEDEYLSIAAASVCKQKIYFQYNFDKEYPISQINADNILSSFRSLYSVDFQEKENFSIFTLNGKKIGCPHWKNLNMEKSNEKERKEYFLNWLIRNLNTALGILEETVSNSDAQYIMQSLENKLCLKEYEKKISCYRLLQAISFSAYCQADTYLRNKGACPLMESNASPYMKYFPTDDTKWKIDIDTLKENFQVTHVKPYRFIKDRFIEEKEKSLGSIEVQWCLRGHLKHSSFSANLWLEKLTFSDQTPLEQSFHIAKALTFEK